MQQTILLLSFTLIFSTNGFTQKRYADAIFDEITVETLTYTTKESQNLDLDLYLPQEDTMQKRTTIIYVHGGGFSGGQRNQKSIVKFCSEIASYGYVVASISYRLTRKGKPEGFGCNCSANEKLNTFNSAVEDLQDATFFLIQNREQYAINPQKIIIAGSSAGAETVLNAAYQPPYCYGLNSGPVSFAGVISMAGAIPDTSVIYEDSAIPSLFFHGTNDNLVPYATAPHHYCTKDKPGYLILHGSYTLAQKLGQLNVPYWLHTTCNGGHELASTPLQLYKNEILEFCNTYIVKKKGKARHTTIKNGQQKESSSISKSCPEK